MRFGLARMSGTGSPKDVMVAPREGCEDLLWLFLDPQNSAKNADNSQICSVVNNINSNSVESDLDIVCCSSPVKIGNPVKVESQE